MKPAYEKVAKVFSSEPDVVIALMDADEAENKPVAQRYGVSSFPTIKFFPKGSKEPVAYDSGRTAEQFVNVRMPNLQMFAAMVGYRLLTVITVNYSGSTKSLALTDLFPVSFPRLPAVSSPLTHSLPSSSPPTSLSAPRLLRRPRRLSLPSTKRARLLPITISRLWSGLLPRAKSG